MKHIEGVNDNMIANNLEPHYLTHPGSAELALLIGKALDLDAAPLLSLQMKYNLLSAKRNKSFIQR